MNSKFDRLAYAALAIGISCLTVFFVEVLQHFSQILPPPLFLFALGAGQFHFVFAVFKFGRMLFHDEYGFTKRFFAELLIGVATTGSFFAFFGSLYENYKNEFGAEFRNYMDIFSQVNFYAFLFFMLEFGELKIDKLLKGSLYVFLGFVAIASLGVYLLKPLVGPAYLPLQTTLSIAVLTACLYYNRVYLRKSWLLLLNGRQAGRDYPLGKDVIFIGNQEDDDVRLGDYLDVNASHAKIVRYGCSELFSFVDNDPFSRSWVNFRPCREQILHNRDLITVGTAKIMFISKNG